MKTVVYISRHSEAFRDLLGSYNANELEQLRNEKNPLSVRGEEKAKITSEIDELRNVEVLVSSHYVRAMSTAKYIAEKNSIKLTVDYRFGERKFGVDSIKDLPTDFTFNQFKNFNYKLDNGESLNEVYNRIIDGLYEMLDRVNGKTSMIVSHGTALTVMLSKWCELNINEDTKLVEIYFNNKMVFDGNWGCPELFRLVFEDKELIDIENVKY